MLAPQTRPGEPAINLPAFLSALILLLLTVQGVREMLPPSADVRLVVDYGFVPARWSVRTGVATGEEVVRDTEREAGEGGQDTVPREDLARYVSATPETALPSLLTYSLLHGSWMHVALNCIWLAAFGTPVVRRCGPLRAAGLAVVTSLGGALAYWMFDTLSPIPMIGASGIVSGFMGAAASFIFGGSASFGRESPAQGLGGLLRNRSALFFLGSWLVVNLLGGVLAGPLGLAAGGIAWQAHLGGLVTGLILFPLIDPLRRSSDRRKP